MAKYLMKLRLNPAEANLAAVSHKLNLSENEIDQDFGIVHLDPPNGNLYAIRVDEAVGMRLQGRKGVDSLSSDPKIEDYGPPTT
jgi:hypothetical protein